MGVCEGCAINFRKLASATCMKCNKLQKTTSDVERLAIEVRSYTFIATHEPLIKLDIRTSRNA
jgi:hypothetical protein